LIDDVAVSLPHNGAGRKPLIDLTLRQSNRLRRSWSGAI
jgi:hypothetical protein